MDVKTLLPIYKRLPPRLRKLWTTPLDRMFEKEIEGLPTELNEFGYDQFGFSPDYTKYVLVVTYLLYKYYFRVELHGVENLPKGRGLLISNHSGQIPIDGVMIATSCMLEANPPRAVRSMVERWVPSLPFVSTFLTRCGQILGTPENARALLNAEELLLVFPEGTRGINKLWWDRYKLERFGLGFMRLALETKTPIVPVSVVGAEEQYPTMYNVKFIANMLGMPALPLAPTMLIPGLGLLPLPVKYHITIGEPILFEGDANDEDVVIDRHVQRVRNTIQQMITYGLSKRKSLFR